MLHYCTRVTLFTCCYHLVVPHEFKNDCYMYSLVVSLNRIENSVM